MNDFPMLGDQAYILEISTRNSRTRCFYDKTVPSAEAVALLDGILVKLAD